MAAQQPPQPENLITVQGNGGVGKTCFVQQLLTGTDNELIISRNFEPKSRAHICPSQRTFEPQVDPTVDEFYQPFSLTVDRQVVKINIHDQAGREEYYALRDYYLRGCAGMVLCFAINDSSSFAAIDSFYESLNLTKDTEHFPTILIGTKCDLPDSHREVPRESAQDWAKAHGVKYLETSAKCRINVEEAIAELVRWIQLFNQTQQILALTKSKPFRARCGVM